MKKIELHCHLDGSLSIRKTINLLNYDCTKELIASNTNNLSEYLDKFKLPIKLLQTKNNLEEYSFLLTQELVKDEVIYAEIRFCPLFHVMQLSLEEVIDAVLKGLRRNKNIRCNLILCLMRQFTYTNNKKIIDLAYKYKNRGVVAIDLAGDEYKYKTSKYRRLFEYASKLDIPFTIHAGEADDYTSVLSAIEFNAKRIGHGIRVVDSNETMDLLIKNNITLEICPQSNFDTKVYNIDNYPINKLINKGILLTINTDNRTVSNTSLNKQYKLLKEQYNITDEQLLIMNINAINASFLNNKSKRKLLKELTKD